MRLGREKNERWSEPFGPECAWCTLPAWRQAKLPACTLPSWSSNSPIDHERLFKAGMFVQRRLRARFELQQHGGRARRRVAIEHLEFDSRRLGVLPRQVVDVDDLGLARERLGLGADGLVAHVVLPAVLRRSLA
jgi:hypothetical protein